MGAISYEPYSASHKLEGDDTKCIEVDTVGVILPEEYFWCHIAGGATGVPAVVSYEGTRNAEVCDSHIALLV